MKWAALVLLLAACGPRPQNSPEALYRQAVLSFRHGDLAEALERARAGQRQSKPGSVDGWNFRLLEAEVLIYQGNPQPASSLLAVKPPQLPGFGDVDARRKMLSSYLQGNQASQAILTLLEDARRQARDPGLLLEIEILRGFHLFPGDPDQARTLFLDARRRAAVSSDAFHEAVALNDLGVMSMRRSRFDEAIPWFEQALTPARLAGASPLVATALNNLTRCYNQLGNFDQAIERRQQALQAFGPGEVQAVRRNLLEGMGRTYALEGNARQATEYYRRALEIARQQQASDDVRRTLANNLAEALVALGDWDAAQQANTEETALAKDDRAKAYAHLNAAVIAAGRQHFDEAAADYQAALTAGAASPPVLWEANAGLGKTYSQLHQDALARRYFENTLRVIEENRAGLSRDQYKITFLSRLIVFYQDYVESLMRSGDTDRALEIADSSRARILAEKISGEMPRPYRAAEYRAYARRTGRILLSYWLAPRQSYAWVVMPQRTECFRLPPSAEIRPLVDSYQAFLEKALRDPLQVESAAARRLYEALIAPAAALLPAKSQVVLVPDGPLHGLNLETLPVYGTNPRYWIEDVTLSIAPSLSFLLSAAPARTPASSKSLLVFADALYGGSSYQPLRYSSAELEKIRRHFASAPREERTGAQATPQAYLEAQPGRFSVIHFSAHAEANRESPLDSAIILSAKDARFKLYARDIMEQPLSSDLVTISACRSAGARAYAGEGLVGLAWAFLRSGAHYTIAGLWDVDDSSTPGIMDTLYGAMESGQSPIQALRTAKLAMIHSTGAYRKPYYWGPFLIYGE